MKDLIVFIILICESNIALITVLNQGNRPLIYEDARYFVMEQGQENRIIDLHEFRLLQKERNVRTTMRKFHYA